MAGFGSLDYVLEFDEEFIGPELRRDRWLPYYLPHWRGQAHSAARYSLSGRGLRLHIEEDQAPWNPEFDGQLRVSNLQTGCYSGPLGSGLGQHRFKPGLTVQEPQPAERLYTPQFGRIEVRLRAVTEAGYLSALWLIGFEDEPQRSAEICVCELFAQDMTDTTLRLGYGLRAFSDPAIVDEFYHDTLALDPHDFHTYAVNWTPTHCDFYADGQHLRRIMQSPQYPMQLMLNVYEMPDQLPAGGRRGPWPKSMEVAFVRGYRLVGAQDTVGVSGS